MIGLKRQHFYFLLMSLLLLCPIITFSQTKNSDTLVVVTDTTNIDALFKKARDFSFDGNNAQARRICQKIP